MSVYYSPDGNAEMWDEKPDGYMTEGEWEERRELAEAARLAEYNSEGSRFERLRAERDRRLDETDYLLMADYPLAEDAGAVVKVYRQALRDLPSQEGAPWDGGGEGTPWPAMPEILQEQQNASTFSYTPGI